MEGLPPDSWERDERAVAWVYGAILTATTVVVASSVVASQPGQVLIYTASTMAVVWFAHSYAAFVGHGGRMDPDQIVIRAIHALRIELPVFVAALPALAATAIASALDADVQGVGFAGLFTAIATIVVVAAGAARRAGAGRIGMAAAALGALVVGGLLVAAKVLLK